MRRLISTLALLAPLAVSAGDDLWSKPATTTVLDADEAFRLLPPTRDGDRLRIEWDVVPGYFLYRDRIDITALAPPNRHFASVQLPAGEPYHDAHFGDVSVYRKGFAATVTGAAGVTRVRVSYQGCAAVGVCLPPQVKEIAVPEQEAH
jgi:thiol:disulfide interchange protein DsbD